MSSGVFRNLGLAQKLFPGAIIIIEQYDWGTRVDISEPDKHDVSFEINVSHEYHISWCIKQPRIEKHCTIPGNAEAISRAVQFLSEYDSRCVGAVEAHLAFVNLLTEMHNANIEESEQLPKN